MLYLESPRDVGFSYRDPSFPQNNTYNDDYTVADNAEFLELFTQRFPEYAGRDFYISGESYAGFYIPVLTREVIRRLQMRVIVFFREREN